ncbi:MAG: non-canonical purine NTP diphosphatase [Bacteroidota bacterium]|nr:non-canonical purine NTP diphosphatase [Bacteroidota bacterium]
MKSIVFATNNQHKLEEIRSIIGDQYEISGLKDIGCYDDIPETAFTLEGNSSLKARFVWDNFGMNCFADDTGLEIVSLGGRPGVHSARYAGEECIADNNMSKVLGELREFENRAARFRTVISLILDGNESLFEGVVYGNIIKDKRGSRGFGYDPIFVPEGYQETFAEMDPATKNSISHRALATAKLANYLQEFCR